MDTALATPDFKPIKQRQQAMWATGDYAVIGTVSNHAARSPPDGSASIW